MRALLFVSALAVAQPVLAVSFLGSAAAQGRASNEAAAESLFNEARALIGAGRLEEGCKKLEASQSLDPGTGTLLHLADCYEKTGRTASAWARFREAASRAARDGRADWESIARTRGDELEPKLAKLRIDAAPGQAVERDGDPIPAAALGSALPIDPGEHTLKATAPGKKPWTKTFTVASASTTTVTVPALADDTDAAKPSTEDGASPPSHGSAMRIVGYTMAAAGTVGVAIGVAGGISAIRLNGRSKDVCPSSGACADESARSDNDDARSAATLSTIGFLAGGALLAGGLALVILAPSNQGSARVRATAGAMWLEGTW